MNKPLVVIAGPTATGKTGLAASLAKILPVILVSADSRQVYQGMDIVTGKDHPAVLTLHGLDLVKPDEECSVSLWYRQVLPAIEQAWQQEKLPIVVGGTGLYLRALTEGIDTIAIPPNPPLRERLQELSIPSLQQRLQKLAPVKFTKLNHSDRHNPRRLIRAIEIASSTKKPNFHPPLTKNSLILGLKYATLVLAKEQIHTRVLRRLANGALQETQQLLSQYSPELPSFSSLGYSYLISYLSKKVSLKELVSLWTQSEYAYYKRQLTWFNKLKQVTWFDPLAPKLNLEVATLVKDWYHKTK